jgi:hypothetical protein
VLIGDPLVPGKEYDALIKLLKSTRASREFKSGEITWPDGRTFTASLAPMENGGCLALLSAASTEPASQTA